MNPDQIKKIQAEQQAASPALWAAIEKAIEGTEPFTPERNKALKKVKWVMRVADVSNNVYAYLNSQCAVDLTDDIKKALVCDGRDNQAMKLSWYQGILNERLEIVLL